MTDFSPRTFVSDAEVAHIGEGLLACSLPRAEWTHEAHLAATFYLLVMHPEVVLDDALPDLIRRYNESVGGVNSDREGYHETITRVFLQGIRLYLSKVDPNEPLHKLVNGLLLSPMGQRDWPLRFYSRERLFGTEARLNFVRPDVAPIPIAGRA